ncbi:MAG: hypothetical protein JW950_05865 [Deltaproteobacteria bacterium]|nr:hypothetical protein [Deltaproteobacteria bacterium]
MGRKIAISFEDDIVKVVYAFPRKERVDVEKTFLLKEDQLDAFLDKENIKDPVIVCHFKNFYSDIISVPPVKKSYLKTIVETEIRKRFPEVGDIAYYYNVLEKKTLEDRGSQDIFFFAVNNSDLEAIIRRFSKHKITVKYIFPDFLTLANLVQASSAASTSTSLSLYISESDKSLFLMKGGQLRFVRSTPSFGREINTVDVDNINMTVNYSRQTFKVSPDQLVLINAVPKVDEAPWDTIIPPVAFTPPAIILADPGVIRDFIVPISALASRDLSERDSLMPQRYRDYLNHKRVFAPVTALFVIIGLLGISWLTINTAEILSLKVKIGQAKQGLADADRIIASYDKSAAELQQMANTVSTINEINSATDVQKFLASLRFFPMKNVVVQDIKFNVQSGIGQFQIAGNITGNNFTERLKIFQNIRDRILQIPGTSINNQNIDLKSGGFLIGVQSK